MEARVCRPPHLFSLPHMTNAVAEYFCTEGPHTYFSVIRLMFNMHYYLQQVNGGDSVFVRCVSVCVCVCVSLRSGPVSQTSLKGSA